MNQTTINKIAEIIKVNEVWNERKIWRDGLVKDLADLFEEEVGLCVYCGTTKEKCKNLPKSYLACCPECRHEEFNRKLFLKNCGVEE